jgi:hypothetical protein
VYVKTTLLVASLMLAACKSGSGPAPTPTAPGPPTSGPPAGPPTITITATGVSPAQVTVAVGGRVTFVNGDVRAHELWGGIDHDHRDCPQVDEAGFLVPGQSRDSGVFTQSRTCDFHDHTNVGNPAYQGRIIVQ